MTDTEFLICTSSFQAAFYGLLLRLFYLCLFIVSGIWCYKSYRKSSLEALKVNLKVVKKMLDWLYWRVLLTFVVIIV